MTNPAAEMSSEDRAALGRAHEALEHPSLAARISSLVGIPVERGLRLLPKNWHASLRAASRAAIAKALDAAITSLSEERRPVGNEGLNKLFAAGAGAASGFFGLPALLVELPVTTMLMLRSIAHVARDEGEDLDLLEPRLACVEVFAVGSRTHADDAAEIGYYEARLAMAWHFSAAAALARHGGASSLPASVNLVRATAARFGVVISEKAGAQMVPIVGAAAGALINTIFIQHFEDVARGHFTVRRLERKYGAEMVRRTYETFSDTDRLEGRMP